MKKTSAKTGSGQPSAPALPAIGRGKWATVAPFVGICRESARKLTLAGKFPKPTHTSQTCALYDFAEVHRWIADPLGYVVSPKEAEAA